MPLVKLDTELFQAGKNRVVKFLLHRYSYAAHFHFAAINKAGRQGRVAGLRFWPWLFG